MSGVFLVLHTHLICLGCILSSYTYTQIRTRGHIVLAKADDFKRLARK